MTRPVLQLEGVGKSYRRGGARSLRQRVTGRAVRTYWVEVLRDVDLVVHPGDAVGIVGRNGGGKSALLRVAGGLTKPSTGTVHRSTAVSGLLMLNASTNGELSGAANAVTARFSPASPHARREPGSGRWPSSRGSTKPSSVNRSQRCAD